MDTFRGLVRDYAERFQAGERSEMRRFLASYIAMCESNDDHLHDVLYRFGSMDGLQLEAALLGIGVFPEPIKAKGRARVEAAIKAEQGL